MAHPDGKEIIPGCEPWSASGGPHGALVIHGFTGNPQGLRGLAEAFAAAGLAVDLPLLPGHGTSVDDMPDTGWDDWSAAAEAAYAALAARGATRWSWPACRWAERSRCGWPPPPRDRRDRLRQPAVDIRAEMVDGIRQMVDGGVDRIPAIGYDVADPAGAGEGLRRHARCARCSAWPPPPPTRGRPGQDHLPGAGDHQPAGPRGRPPQQRHRWPRGVSGPGRAGHAPSAATTSPRSTTTRTSSRAGGGVRGAGHRARLTSRSPRERERALTRPQVAVH